jgi:hypothetical protein
MYLKTSTAKVSSMTASLAEKAQLFWSQFSPVEEAVRKDSAVHVSLSSDSLVKQPGTSRLRRQKLLRLDPEKRKPAHPTRLREHGH